MSDTILPRCLQARGNDAHMLTNQPVSIRTVQCCIYHSGPLGDFFGYREIVAFSESTEMVELLRMLYRHCTLVILTVPYINTNERYTSITSGMQIGCFAGFIDE